MPENLIPKDGIFPAQGAHDPMVAHRQQLNRNLGFRLSSEAGIEESLNKIKFHLNDSSSPVISNFLHLLDYNDGSELKPFVDFAEGEIEEKMDRLLLENEKLQSLIEKVSQMKSGLRNIFFEIEKSKKEIKDHIAVSKKIKEDWQSKRDERVRLAVGEKVDNLYHEFLTANDVLGEDT